MKKKLAHTANYKDFVSFIGSDLGLRTAIRMLRIFFFNSVAEFIKVMSN